MYLVRVVRPKNVHDVSQYLVVGGRASVQVVASDADMEGLQKRLNIVGMMDQIQAETWREAVFKDSDFFIVEKEELLQSIREWATQYNPGSDVYTYKMDSIHYRLVSDMAEKKISDAGVLPF